MEFKFGGAKMQITWTKKQTLEQLNPGQVFSFEGRIYIKLQIADEIETKKLKQAEIMDPQTHCYIMSPETGLIFIQKSDIRVRPITAELSIISYNPLEER